ncbi:MAG TPA: M13 family metallopeptidase, partial [Terriglobia bacterium]|nr:M13 family metallopeptidase [Terriglobia bacterium]
MRLLFQLDRVLCACIAGVCIAALALAALAVAPRYGLFAKGALSARRNTGGQTPPLQHSPLGAPSSLHGYNPQNLDTHVSPCRDFYQYAVGGWRARNPIPEDYPQWGVIQVVARRNKELLRGILERDATSATVAAASGRRSLLLKSGGQRPPLQNQTPPADNTKDNETKLGNFYASCMEVKAVDAEGAKPLDPEFKRINTIHDVPSLEAEIEHLQSLGVDAPFVFASEQDYKNSSEVTGVAWQAGLGLPNCTYYTQQDAKSNQIRSQYVEHAVKLFELLGDPPSIAAAEAASVMKTETMLARASMTPVELRDPQAVYHRMARPELRALTPDFSWPAYFHETGHPNLASINVGQPDFFRAVNRALTGLPLPAWKTYLRWQLIDQAAPYLSDAFVNEDFNFKRVLTGAKQLQPRWMRCVNAVDAGMGMALGEQYVQTAFPPSSKAEVDAMVQNLISALGGDISTLPWMGPETKTFALAKLKSIQRKIGYPGEWRDYSALAITRGPYVMNVLNADRFEFNRLLDKIGKPVDRNEWVMTPPTVNAYYDPSMNDIVFPAGILQPPLFDPSAASALN